MESVEVLSKLDNVDTLRKKGYNVRVCHLRCVHIPVVTTKGIKVEKFLYNKSEVQELVARGIIHHVSPIGGFTRVELTTPEGVMHVGVTESRTDTFNRKLGLHIALQRIFKKMGVEV